MGHHKEHASHFEKDFKVGKKNEAEAKKASEVEIESAEAEDNSLEGTLHAQQERLMKRLQELKDASGDAWTELKTGGEKAFDELRDSVQKVITRFEAVLGQHGDKNHEAKP